MHRATLTFAKPSALRAYLHEDLIRGRARVELEDAAVGDAVGLTIQMAGLSIELDARVVEINGVALLSVRLSETQLQSLYAMTRPSTVMDMEGDTHQVPTEVFLPHVNVPRSAAGTTSRIGETRESIRGGLRKLRRGSFSDADEEVLREGPPALPRSERTLHALRRARAAATGGSR